VEGGRRNVVELEARKWSLEEGLWVRVDIDDRPSEATELLHKREELARAVRRKEAAGNALRGRPGGIISER